MVKIFKSIDPRRSDLPYPTLVAHQPEFLPWLGNISKAAMGDVYFILDSVQYCKELFQNRNKIRIKNGNGWQWLTIPISNPNNKLMQWTDVRIDNKQNWKSKHLKSIQLSYGKAPYFKEIYPEIELIYNSFEGDKLMDFLMEFIKYSHKKFKLEVPIYRTSELIKNGYVIESHKSELVLSMCKVVEAKAFIFGALGRDYIEKEKFTDVEYGFQKYIHPVYRQIQGPFMPNMCFLDILFNYGVESVDMLNKSTYDKV